MSKQPVKQVVPFNKRPRDVGLQPERTVLSWFRTIAVIYLNALLMIKIGSSNDNPIWFILGGVVLIIATLMYAYTLGRNRVINLDIDIISTKSLSVHRLIAFALFGVASFLLCYFLFQLSQI